MLSLNEMIDGLEMLKFFNQRSGRELWADKPVNIQNADIKKAESIYDNTIEFLKEYEPVKPIFRTNPRTMVEDWCCGSCRYNFVNVNDNYCSHCGRKIKWNETEMLPF